jgi:uncharacterized protein (DUF362 family)
MIRKKMRKLPPTVSIIQTRAVEYGQIDIDKMVRESLEPLGGMNFFVSPGQRVLIKPNAVSNLPATSGATTEPRIVGALVQLALEAGAREVWVGDSSCNWSNSYQVMNDLGLVREIEQRGGKVLDLDTVPSVSLNIPNGKAVRQVEVPQPLVEADVIIDVPKAKTHMIDSITCCLKNWVGIIPQRHRLGYHQMPRLAQIVADIMTQLAPSLCVVDALIIGEGEGPLNVDPRFLGLIIAGNDPVATEVIIGELLGFEADELVFAWAAYLEGLGEIDRNKIQVFGPPLDKLKIRAHRPIPAIYNRFPCNIVLGGACWGGLTWFVGTAVTWQKDGTWQKVIEGLGTPTFMMGFNAEDPAFDEHLAVGPYFIVGDCAPDKYKQDERTIVIPGCPPGPALPEAVLRMLKGGNHGKKNS